MIKRQNLLVDTGSAEPASALALRRLAIALSERSGAAVRAASLLHADKIPAERLGGLPALMFAGAVREAAAAGAQELAVVPLSIGPGRALSETLPAQFRAAGAPGLRLLAAPPLYGPDAALRRILLDNLLASGWARGCRVLLCDHGSPSPAVTAVRDSLAAELRLELGLAPGELDVCSMERRPGAGHCGPSLAGALAAARGEVVVLMLFLLPGRHAGPGGDVETICAGSAAAGTRWRLTRLIGEHPALPELLAARLGQVRPAEKVGG